MAEQVIDRAFGFAETFGPSGDAGRPREVWSCPKARGASGGRGRRRACAPSHRMACPCPPSLGRTHRKRRGDLDWVGLRPVDSDMIRQGSQSNGGRGADPRFVGDRRRGFVAFDLSRRRRRGGGGLRRLHASKGSSRPVRLRCRTTGSIFPPSKRTASAGGRASVRSQPTIRLRPSHRSGS